MTEHTRFVRLAADVHRAHADNQGTRISREFPSVVLTDHRTLFNHHQRRLHQVLREFAEPGVALFALHPVHGLAGRFWLSATDNLRAGTVGRHSEVDLYLPHDEELSLRHLLVLVRASLQSGIRIQVLDLATPGGFQAEQGGLLRAVDANGTLVLRAAGYSLFLFPTGTPPPWDPDAADPWRTLPPRVLVSDERLRRQRRAWGGGSPGETSIASREGPEERGAEALVEAGERPAGHLVLRQAGTEERLPVGERVLERGLILGRYSRCAGDTAVMSHDVSRVHAVMVRTGGALHLVDAGSTNGTWADGRAVKCVEVAPGQTYTLGKLLVRWEPTH